ncbi:dynein axonemal heavy chain 2 [Hetaerina americana]|uniref:dynein axonemal heavy chain 2 n=1 Tax=Hetaerina americana TaxID=62018 RepID=UPI003A7F60B7
MEEDSFTDGDEGESPRPKVQFDTGSLPAEESKEFIKNDICMALHQFLSNLTVIHYQKFGLTVLYLPNDGLEKSLEEAVADVDLIKRWECVVIRWFKQIEKVLKESETGFSEGFGDPTDFYDLWLRRLHNLFGIEHQLKLPTVVKITRALNNAGSSFTEPIVAIIPTVLNAIEEAKYNLSFLELLNEPCRELKLLTSPAEIPSKIPNIIMTMLVIWNASTYFGERDKMTPICLSLSNCVLAICATHVNINEIAEGKTRRVMCQLQESIEGCLKYRLTYRKYTDVNKKHGKTNWNLEEDVIFKDCESFLERCRDALEICRDMIYFARIDETQDIPKPTFGGCQWQKNEKVMAKLEEQYKGILGKTLKHQHIMLDTRSLEWNDVMLKYRQEVKHIESALENLATSIFKKVDCIEKGIEALFSFRQFIEKPSMKAFFQVLEVFNKEIICTKTELAQKRIRKPFKLPPYAGAAFVLNSRMEVLKQEYEQWENMMAYWKGKEEARLYEVTGPSALVLMNTHWLPMDELLLPLKENFEALNTLVKDRQKELYGEWRGSMDHNIPMRLNRPIIAVSSINPGKLIPNFDVHLRKLATEIKYWKMLSFDVPPALKDFYEKSSTYQMLYNRVFAFTRDYNFLSTVLSDSELVLFKELVVLIDDRIHPALTSITWLSPDIEKFVDECCSHSLYLREVFKEYKTIHLKVREFCNKIGSVKLFIVQRDHVYSYDELIEEQREHRDKVIPEMMVSYHKVKDLIDIVHEMFEDHLHKIKLDPPAEFTKTKLLTIMTGMIKSMEVVPRILTKFHIIKTTKPPVHAEINNDVRWARLKSRIDQIIEDVINGIEDYIKEWMPFSDVWRADMDIFMKNYKENNPSLDVIVHDIQRFEELAANAESIKTDIDILFMKLDAFGIKASLADYCHKWHGRFCTCLSEMTYKRLMKIHERLNELGEKNLIAEELEQRLIQNLATEEMRDAVIKLVNGFELESEQLLVDFLHNGPYTSDWKALDALKFLKDVRLKCKDIRDREVKLQENMKTFNVIPPLLAELDEIDKEIVTIELVWEVVHEIDESWGKHTCDPFRNIKGDELDSKVHSSYRKIVRLHRELKAKEWQIITFMKDKVEKMRRNLPVINALINPSLRERHWEKIKAVVQIDFDHQADSFTLDSIEEYKLSKFHEQISDISSAATMELNIEQGLLNIKTLWESIDLDIYPHKTKGVYRLKGVDDIFSSIEENQVTLATMKSTRFVEPFIQEVEHWERALVLMVEVLEMVLTVQRQYLYLENIFLGEDIRKQLPEESGDFDIVSKEWKVLTSAFYQEKNALRCSTFPGNFTFNLNSMNIRLEEIQKLLEEFLETKRHAFPRFYFISNDDLLEILGHSKNPEAVQPHLKKCFDNIHKLKARVNLSTDHLAALGMYSGEGEYVDFSSPVLIKGAVENWLNFIVTAMRDTLKHLLKLCCIALRKQLTKRDKWVKDWPGQICICASQVQWTTDCTKSLQTCKIQDTKKPLKKLRKKQNQVLSKFSDAVRGDLTKLQRLKIVSLVTIEIHARDVIDKLYKAGCKDVTAFEWLSQLRFSWDKDIDSCVARQTNTYFVYGYEYLGNSGRLVVTPLTDRCYITLTTALHLHRGGSPKGPAGTGKTETVKDLGKGLGCYVIVINCSEGLDYKSMGRMFSGFAQTGAWGCFDEFNRINIEVLSVVAQQILSILQALAQGKKDFVFEGEQIKLVHTCGIFITMNPGYAGRTELPDNLKSMFRPISMIVPDSCLIAEIILFGEGFKETRVLAKKVYTLYSLAIQQLSKQDHYDFGLRSMVALLRYAGRKRRAFSNYPDEEVVLLAMKDMNVAKLTSNDLPLFNGIITDLFPGVKIPIIDYEELSFSVEEELKANGLQPLPTIVTKVIQLHETKISRHSVMIVGRTGSGKSVTWKTLQRALSRLGKEKVAGYNIVWEYPINPKALSLGELYGEFNLSTGEWLDGVLSAIMRETCSDERSDEKWVVFDGPVDAVWIENMNSVMDDNKVLTLINSDRISMPDQVSLLFEVEDLSVASPATVSRCGMVYNDYKDLGWKPYVHSWLQKHSDHEFVEEMQRLMDRYMAHILEFKRLNCEEVVPTTDISIVTSMCNFLDCFSTKENGLSSSVGDTFKTTAKQWFFFCLIWSVCACVNEEGRMKLDAYIRELEGMFPLKDTVYEYYVDPATKSFLAWETRLKENWKFDLSLPFYKIMVPTVDTLRYQFLIFSLLSNGFPVLLVGSVGTGKTSLAQEALDSMDKEKYSILTINMSAQTSSNNVQDIIISKMEKRSKGIYLPISGNKLITFMDDFNMPARETYGAQPPLELIRQWIDYGFCYNREKQTPMYIHDMLLMAAMGPPGGGRNVISNRLLSCFNVINMTFPDSSQIERIYGTMIYQKLNDFDDDVKPTGKPITFATIALYNAVVVKMLPTPTKIHYLFNLRDISKVFQGLLRSHNEQQTSRNSFLRLWIHECYRVFCDRLVDLQDREWFENQISIQLADYFDLTFHSVCPGRVVPIFGDFASEDRIYEDFVDFGNLKKRMEQLLIDYNKSPGVVPMDLVLFRDAIEHITRITRVLSQPRGNMLLIGIGGSGRQSLARFASFLCDYDCFRIEIRKQYRTQEFREDLKTLYQRTGVDAIETTFLFSDSQVVDENFLEIINNILSSGEVPNLFRPEEFEEIKNALQSACKADNIGLTTAAIFTYFIERVRASLHIILCMSPIGSAFRNRIRQYPAIVNCTTLDWFSGWPEEALLEVANRSLAEVKLNGSTEEPEEALRMSVATIFASIHYSVYQCSTKMLMEMKRHNYVTATNYLELVSGYKMILQNKRKELNASANKLRNGLLKIDETKEKIEVMAVELEEAQKKVSTFQQECDDYLVVIAQQKREADEQQKSVVARSKKIKQEETACLKLADIAQADLDEAMPALEEAMRALDALNKKDLSEIKSYGRPPVKVEMVMEAVMILKCVEPSWAEAKRQLGDANFLVQLRDFDKDNISDKTLKKIALYTTNPEFDPEKVGIVSVAAKSLCMWVRAIEKYGKIYRIVAPKRAKLEEARDNLKEKQAILLEAQNKLDELSETLNKLKKEYDEKLLNKEELRKKADELQMKMDRAALLVSGLSEEKQRWTTTVKFLDEQCGYLPGDCLLATAFVAYMGPFVSVYREELMRSWIANVKKLNIPHSPEYSLINFFEDPATIREWNFQGLPSDDFSIENGIIVNRSYRSPLIIDPQSQALKWVRTMESAKGVLSIIDLQQYNFMRVIEIAIQQGTTVLIKNVMEELDPSLTPILDKALVTQGGQLLLKLSDKMIQYNENFRLYITTKLGNPHYPPEISTKATLVNFAVKEQGLEAQLLGVVVRKERPDLEEQKDALVSNIAAGKKLLKHLEDEILRLLNETEGSLLDNIELVNTLQTSKSTSVSVKEQLEISEKTEIEIDAARELYRPCSERASILFFVLNDLGKIDPMYQFSLDSYFLLFINSIEKSPKKANLDDRIGTLNEFHTYSVYRNTCRGLFEMHKLLFSFHMCLKILEAKGKINSAEYKFLLRGGVVLDRDEQMDNPCPGWLSDTAWDSITELDKVPGFHGAASSFEQSPRDWHSWYIATEPENTPLVGQWGEICSEFQQMLFVRSLRPDRISFCATSFISKNMGLLYVEPPVLDMHAVLDDSNALSPLIFVLSPGVDPTTALIQLSESVGMDKNIDTLSLGQGQAPIATRLIHSGMQEGNWVFLANCHLSMSWMPELDKIVEELPNSNVNPRFRLWLSSSPHPDFPVSILQAATKMTTEPPKGLKANMKRLYQLITDVQFSACIRPEKYKKLLFSLCFFHSILLERKKFQQLGWNVSYSFNDSDFEVSESLLSLYLNEYPETPWDALKYLIAGVNYGGHVTDDWDRRLLFTYINNYFNDEVLNSQNYRLSSLPTYYIPRDGSLQSYKDYVVILPNVDRPEVFGQHTNADITSLITETRCLFDTLLSLQVQTVDNADEKVEDKVTQTASEVLAKIPEPIDYESVDKLTGEDKSPLMVVLLQEIQRYNVLLVSIKSSVEELQKGIQGIVVMSAELEEMYTCMNDGRVPPAWLKAYPSMKLLGSWTRDLVQRVQHFAQWATTLRPPALFWLSAFTFPTGLLTAVLQTSARQVGISVDSLSWEFQIVTLDESLMQHGPDEGIYVRGIFLEGAGWDKKHLCLTEPAPMQLVCSLPVIHFKPVEQLKKKTRGIYICPCYYLPERCGSGGRPSFVVAVELKSGAQQPDYWVKRGTALLLSLAQ